MMQQNMAASEPTWRSGCCWVEGKPELLLLAVLLAEQKVQLPLEAGCCCARLQGGQECLLQQVDGAAEIKTMWSGLDCG
jgi:hypothetical protein